MRGKNEKKHAEGNNIQWISYLNILKNCPKGLINNHIYISNNMNY